MLDTDAEGREILWLKKDEAAKKTDPKPAAAMPMPLITDVELADGIDGDLEMYKDTPDDGAADGGTLPYDRFPLVDGYDDLYEILRDAYNQSARGKGKERHAGTGKPFDRQPIMEIGRMCGLGYATGQAQKKTQEAVSMFARGDREAADRELLGSIVYLAAAIKLIREQ